MRSLAAGLLIITMPGTAWTAQSAKDVDLVEYCEHVTVSPPIKFHGKLLNEIPDITEPELRLANQLLSTGCDGHAYQLWSRFAKANPTNTHAAYFDARFKWMQRGTAAAEAAANKALAQDPGFASVKVLLAGVRLEQARYEDARTLLNEVEKRSPTDLWVFMNRLRLEAVQRPSRSLRGKLLELVRNPGFPPNARDVAADIGISLPTQSNAEVEEFMWERLEVISRFSWECKVSSLARRLSEIGGRYEEARKLLESWRADRSECDSEPMNSLLLAQAYLMAAAKIAPQPGPANAALMDKAADLVGWDFRELRAYVDGRPNAATLAPFMVPRSKPEPTGADGRTSICTALKKMDQAAVYENLQRGSNPNGTCDRASLLGTVMFVETNDRVLLRQAIARTLMSRGAEPTPDEIQRCGQLKYGDCSKVMMPLLEEHLR